MRIASPKFLAASLLIIVSIFVFVVRGRPVARAATAGAPEHVLSFAYYSIKDDWDSTLTLNNSSVAEVTAAVTAYSLDGWSLPLPKFSLKPTSNVVVSLRDLISRNEQSGQFQEGSLEVRFNSDDSMAIAPQLTVSDPQRGLSFDMEPPMMPMSSTLEGLWWSLDDDASVLVMLSNTTGEAVKSFVNVELLGRVVERPEVLLSAHQTTVLDVKQMLTELKIDVQSIERGGISITHNGMPGAVIGHGVLVKQRARFASNLPFVDPKMQKNSILNGTGLMLGHPASGSPFPKTSFFTPQLALRNVSDSSQAASVTVRYAVDGVLKVRNLPSITVAPHEVRMADFSSLMSEVSKVQVTAASLRIDSSGAPGTLVAALTSSDVSQNIEVDVPLVSRSERSGEGGNHPFRLDETFSSLACLTNITSKPTKVAVIIFHDGVMYLPPLIDIAPGGTAVMDLLQLRDSQTKDIQGHTLPANLIAGQFFWHPHQGEALIGRVAMLDKTGSTTSNFSCPNCCQMEPGQIDIVPGVIAGQIGEYCQLTVWEWDTYCGQFHTGPYNYTNSVNYSCDNSSVATVNSGGGVSCMGLGDAMLTVSFDYYHSDYISAEDCALFLETAFASAPITVFRLRIRTSDTGIYYENSDSGASIVAGEGFAITVEAINAVGNVIPNVNAAVSTNASRTLGSTEVGVPSSFTIVNGSYNSPGIVLNRVNGTDSGTSYRFSTAAGGFKDFSFYTYFRVTMDVERWKNCSFSGCPNPGSYFCQIACGSGLSQPTAFVSLTSTGLCNRGVVVANPSNGISQSTTVREVGPRTSDAYWTNGSIPVFDPNNRVGTLGGCLSDVLMTNLGIANGCNSGEGEIVWRFQ